MGAPFGRESLLIVASIRPFKKKETAFTSLGKQDWETFTRQITQQQGGQPPEYMLIQYEVVKQVE